MSARAGHEPNDVAVARLLRLAAALMVGFSVVLLAMYGLWHGLHTPKAIPLGMQPPGPRLQVHPAEDRAAQQDRERRFLESYGWIDSDAGIAHIPIDRAMVLLVKQHARPATEPAR